MQTLPETNQTIASNEHTFDHYCARLDQIGFDTWIETP